MLARCLGCETGERTVDAIELEGFVRIYEKGIAVFLPPANLRARTAARRSDGCRGRNPAFAQLTTCQVSPSQPRLLRAISAAIACIPVADRCLE